VGLFDARFMANAARRPAAGHARGKAFHDVVRNRQSNLDHVPDIVIWPHTERAVIDMLDWCSRDAITVIPYGGRSSVVGRIEPRFDRPAVTLDPTAPDAALEIGCAPGSRTTRCDEDLHRARLPESLESGRGVVDAGDLGSQIGDL
jgi:FAD/FMN-containing dehydrogenase